MVNTRVTGQRIGRLFELFADKPAGNRIRAFLCPDASVPEAGKERARRIRSVLVFVRGLLPFFCEIAKAGELGRK